LGHSSNFEGLTNAVICGTNQTFVVAEAMALVGHSASSNLLLDKCAPNLEMEPVILKLFLS
jgi:hypothetical protein